MRSVKQNKKHRNSVVFLSVMISWCTNATLGGRRSGNTLLTYQKLVALGFVHLTAKLLLGLRTTKTYEWGK